jgi:hypothetical protein
MSGRILNTTLLLTLSSFPALGLLLTAAVGAFGGRGWATLLIATACGSAALVVTARRRGWSAILAETAPRFALPGWLGWIAVAVAACALLPSVVALLAAPRLQISHHGYFHSAYVYQVIAGHVPPENVTLPGHASNTYWPYHALLAALVELLRVPAPLASALLNVAILAGSLAWTAAVARELYGPARPGLGMLRAVFGLFGANLIGGLYWILVAAAGGPLEPRTMVIAGDVRLATLLAKFVNYTGAGLGVYFYVFGLLAVVRTLRGRARGFDVALAVMALLGAFALHAITGAFMLAGFAGAVAGALAAAALLDGRLADLVSGRSLRARLRAHGASTRLGPSILGLLVLLVLGVPVLRFVASAGSEFPQAPRIGLPDTYAWSVVATSWPLWPFFAAGIVRGVRERDARVLFLALTCLGGYAVASVVSISGRNEYKFIYLGSLGLCLVALGPITRLVTSRALGWRSAGPLLAALVLLLACWNVALFGIGLLRGPLFADRTFAYEGRHVTAATPEPGSVMPGTGIEYADLFAWIRAQTPPDTVVVVPLIFRDQSVLYVLSERVPYVVDGVHYNRGLPAFEERAAQIDALYRWVTPAPQRRAMLRDIDAALPGRPKVLVFPRALTARFDPGTAGLTRVREGTVADLYAFPGTTTDGAS